MNKNKTPQIRFNDYTDDWEQREFVNVFTYLQNNSLSRAELSYEHGEVFNIHYGDILVEFGDCLNVKNDKLPLIKNHGITDKYKSSYLKNGDIIIADAAEDETVGKCCEIKGLDNELILSGLHTIPCRPAEEFAPGYLGYYMNSNAYHDQLLPLMQGTKVSSISKSSLRNTSIISPKGINEQEKIGIFFQNLDNLISLHQHKYDKLGKIKKSMLENMFPKEGENVPKVRFSGFTDTWEQCKLGELSDIVRGASPRPIKDPKWFDDKSKVGWLRISDVTEQDGRIRFLEQRISKAGQEKTRVLYEPHLLLSIAATVGKPVVNYVETRVHDGFLIFLNPKFNQEFMFQWFEMFRPMWQQFGQPGSQVNLNSDLVKNTTIKIPIMEEQEQIGEFLKSIDNLITLHQHKLEKLKNIKKSCLEKMFI